MPRSTGSRVISRGTWLARVNVSEFPKVTLCTYAQSPSTRSLIGIEISTVCLLECDSVRFLFSLDCFCPTVVEGMRGGLLFFSRWQIFCFVNANKFMWFGNCGWWLRLVMINKSYRVYNLKTHKRNLINVEI